MKYYYLRKNEINKLKKGLMGKRTKRNRKTFFGNKRYHPHNSANNANSTKSYYSFRNDEIAEDFEKNIRECLIHDCKFKRGNIEREFSYRTITFKNINKIIRTNQTISFKIKRGIYTKFLRFRLNNEQVLEFIYSGNSAKYKEQNEFIIKICQMKITVGKLRHIEMDGLFSIKNFNPSILKKEEISIIFNNIKEEEYEKYTNAALEVKYSKTNFVDLVEQLKKDKNVLNKITNTPFIFIGITNSKNIDKKDLKKQMNNLNRLKCLIFGLKNSTFYGRPVTKFIDWKKLYEDEKKFEECENNFNNLNRKIDDINKKMDDINKKMDLLFGLFNIQNA